MNQLDSMTVALQAYLPMLGNMLKSGLLFLIIIVIGWLVSSWLGAGVAALLRKARFNDLAGKAGISTFLESSAIKEDASGFIGLIIKWVIRLLALVGAFGVLEIREVSELLMQLIEWMTKNLLVAAVVLVIGGWAANAVYSLVRGAAKTAEAENSNMLANLAKTAVLVLTGVVAINQLGIAQELVQMLFAAVVGALAIGVGLAIGLGGKELAGEILRAWYDKSKDNA